MYHNHWTGTLYKEKEILGHWEWIAETLILTRSWRVILQLQQHDTVIYIWQDFNVLNSLTSLYPLAVVAIELPGLLPGLAPSAQKPQCYNLG